MKQDGSIIQVQDYYAFGMEMNAGNTVSPSPLNQYKYNGKELQAELGEYDYGARFYDPVIARWNVIDPKSEKYLSWSPYNYTAGNPLRFIDPNGKEIININGGVRFTGLDAQIAFSALKRQSESNSHFSIHFVRESETPSIYKHTLNSFRKGQPQVLHYDSDKKRQMQRRYEATKSYPSRASEGLQRDEYPYASTFEGGKGADVAYVPSKENSMQGRDLAMLYRTLRQNDPFLVFPVPREKERDLQPETNPLPSFNPQIPVVPILPVMPNVPMPVLPEIPIFEPLPLLIP